MSDYESAAYDEEALEVGDAEVAREELEAGDDEPSDGESLCSADDDDGDEEGAHDEVYRAPPKRHCSAADYASALVALDQQTIAALKRHVGQLRGLIGEPNDERDRETIRKLKRVVEDQTHVIELVALIKSVEREMEAK